MTSNHTKYTFADGRQVGDRPGTLVAPEGSPIPRLEAYRYSAEEFERIEQVDLEHLDQLTDGDNLLWLDVNGLGDPRTIAAIGEHFGLHRLTVEDIMALKQRPKVEDYDKYLFAVAQFPLIDENTDFEQISLVIGRNFVLSFQAYEVNRLEPVLKRLMSAVSRVRRSGPDYLVYAIFDLIVDNYFPVLDRYDIQLEDIEMRIKQGAESGEINELFQIKRALSHIRRMMWGTRDAMTYFTREQHELVRPESQVYFRDAQDHVVRIIEFSETARETCTALTDFHFSQQGQRMNEIMKVLTIIATLFIPLTFVAGIYGMNFDSEASDWNMPELGWKYGYIFFWLLEAGVVIFMLWWFRRIGWLGSPRATPDSDD